MAKFSKGTSGNPAGRPKGTGSAQKLRKLIEIHAPALIDKAVELALSGEVAALKLLLERLVPVMKPSELPIEIGGLEGSLADQGRAVLEAVRKGEINPAQAAQLMQGVHAQARVVEVAELEHRISELEKRHGTASQNQAA